MPFYLSTGISDTILSLLYLSCIFLLESWLLHLWVSFDVDYALLKSYYNSLTVLLLQLSIVTDVIASSEPQVLPQLHIKVCMGNIQNIQTIIQLYKWISKRGEILKLHNFLFTELSCFST